MPSFVPCEQLGDQAAMKEELGPYLEKAWKLVRFECNINDTTPAGPAGSADNQASGAQDRAASASAAAGSGSGAAAPSAARKPLVPKGHFDAASIDAAGNEAELSEGLAAGRRSTVAEAAQCYVSILPAPRMTIAILVVGTRGDVQPFLRLGQRLKADGHRVRLATHNQYEGFVTEGGLEFYPIGGDPKKLSGYMCQSNGRLMPNMLNKEEREQIPEKMGMLQEMMRNTWPAVSDPYPEGSPEFKADAVIANPVAYGHVHVAERLDVPVHLMFPQPWSPTGDLPHPLSILGGGCGSRDFRPEGIDAAFRRAHNLSTYYAIDEFLYAGMRYMTNEFRTSMKLDKIRAGEDGAHILNTHAVPFAYQWSPHLLPKPHDYGPNLEVTGTIFNEDSSYEPPPELEAFFRECEDEKNPPVFVGFGSMMIAEPQLLADTIIEAARTTGTRVILQSSWSSFHIDDGDSAKKLVYQLGNCPHDWLFRHVTAVVHHGGAGTAAAGIRAGVPTLICPFFGDQHLWAQAFVHQGIAVEPCPIQDLNPELLAAAFRTLRGLDEKGKKMRRRCLEVGRQLQDEDGVAGGVDCFYKHLPVEGMVCDVSLLLAGERDVRMARWFSPCLGLKLCPEAYAALKESLPMEVFDKCNFQRYHCGMAWGFAEPQSIVKSVTQGWKHLATRYAQAGVGIVMEPIKGGYQGGVEKGLVGALQGGLEGTAHGLMSAFKHVKYSTRRLILRPLKALKVAMMGSDTRGGRCVTEDEAKEGYHSYEPAGELSSDERSQWLEAFMTVQALHEAWITHAPGEDRPGEHKDLLLKKVAELLLDLKWDKALSALLELHHGHLEESEDGGEEDANSEGAPARRHTLRLGCLTAMAAIPKKRGTAESPFDVDKELSFEEVAALVQQHPAPKEGSRSPEALVREVLKKRAKGAR